MSVLDIQMLELNMTKKQRKLVEIWIVMICLFFVVGIFQDNDVIARAAFIPVVIYFFLNKKEIRGFESAATTVKETMCKSKSMSTFGIIYLFMAIVVAYYFLLSGKDLGHYISGFWSLILVFLAPLLVPIIKSQRELFIALGKREL